MSGTNHDSDFQDQQQRISNPSAFLNLNNEAEQSLDYQSVVSRKREKDNQPNELNIQGRANSTSTNKQQKKQKEVTIKNKKKKIKKHQTSQSDSQGSYHQRKSKKQSKKKTEMKGKRRGRKAKCDTEQLKKQLNELIDGVYPSDQRFPDKGQPSSKRYFQDSKKNIQDSLINHVWRTSEPDHCDWSSVEAEINEQTINNRIQSQLYKKLVQLVNQNNDNIIEQIAELPLSFCG